MTLIITGADVERLLTVGECIDAMGAAFKDFAEGIAVSRPRVRYLAQHPDRIARVCLANTGMFLRDPAEPIKPEELVPSGPFAAFQKMVLDTPNWPHWEQLAMMTITDLPDAVKMAQPSPKTRPSRSGEKGREAVSSLRRDSTRSAFQTARVESLPT